MSGSFETERDYSHEKLVTTPIAEVPRRQPRVVMTIGIDLGEVWSHYRKLNHDGDAGVRGRSRSQLHMAHELTCRFLATSGPETMLRMWADDYSSLLPVLR